MNNEELDVFVEQCLNLRKQGMSYGDIAKKYEIGGAVLRHMVSEYFSRKYDEVVSEYNELKEKGLSRKEIAKAMGFNESTLRSFENNLAKDV